MPFDGTHLDAMEKARELAFKGWHPLKIGKALDKKGLGGLLHLVEIEALAREAGMARSLALRRPSRWLPRTVGMIAILLGIGAVSLGGGMGRHSPAGYGILAVIFGLVLVIKPGWSDTTVR